MELPSCEAIENVQKILDPDPDHPKHVIDCFLSQSLPIQKFNENSSIT